MVWISTSFSTIGQYFTCLDQVLVFYWVFLFFTRSSRVTLRFKGFLTYFYRIFQYFLGFTGFSPI